MLEPFLCFVKMSNRFIEVKNATVFRGEVEVLKGISLDINLGEHLVILGPNGCGKSTLLGLLSRKFRAKPGPNSFVKINGREREDLFELRKNLGIVSDNELERMLPSVTVEGVIASSYFAAVSIFPGHSLSENQWARIDALIIQFGLENFRKRAFAHLSSGQKKKVLLARALVPDPPVLIFDEVTNSLDMKASQEVLDLISVQAKQGKTILMVTHHLHEILPEFERVVMIKDGKIFRNGQKRVILTRENLSEVFDFNIKIYDSRFSH